MAYNLHSDGIPRHTTHVLIGALALTGVCLLMSILVDHGTGMWRYLLVALGAAIAGLAFLRVGVQLSYLWWMLPCATTLFAMSLSLGLKVLVPTTNTLFISGLVLAGTGLGFSLVAKDATSPKLLFAVAGLVLLAALVMLLNGLGYAFSWVTLLLGLLGYSFAIAALLFPTIILYALGGVVAILSLFSSPSPASSLRLLLPMVLLVGGLTLLRYSRNES
jgi:hypothetical protein